MKITADNHENDSKKQPVRICDFGERLLDEYSKATFSGDFTKATRAKAAYNNHRRVCQNCSEPEPEIY